MANAGLGRNGGAGQGPGAVGISGIGEAGVGVKRVWRPGMEQFVNAIKWKSGKDGVKLCMPQGFKLPEVLR